MTALLLPPLTSFFSIDKVRIIGCEKEANVDSIFNGIFQSNKGMFASGIER
jgi:hypothetical protein